MQMRIIFVAAAIAACTPAERTQDPSTKKTEIHATSGTGGNHAMAPMTCDAARHAIETHRFTGWRGLPQHCTPDALFGIPFDDQWGKQPLGSDFAPARTHLLELGGYYRPMAYVREGHAVMFDAMTPALDGGWPVLAADLGTPEATFDWVFGTTPMAGGEHVYASRGITIFLNPDNNTVVYISVYASTTCAEYAKNLRPPREKRPNLR